MNKLFALLALLFLSAIFLPACSDNTDKPLVVACVASSSPYCYYVGAGSSMGGGGLNRPVAGIDIDLIQEIGNELGRPIQYKIVPFQHIFTLVSSGEADIGAAGLTITEERAKHVLFSTVYDTSSQVAVVPEDSDITDGKTLKQVRVAAQEGTTDISFLRENVKPKLVLPFLTQEDVNDALIDGRADAAMMDLMQAEYLVKASDEEFRILDDPVCKVQYGLIFNQENPGLADAANKVIDRFKTSGELQKSREKHIKALDAFPIGAQKNNDVKPFVVCVESSFAPFVFMNRNQLVGVDIEMAEAIADELKRPIQIRIVPFSEVLPLVESGAADMGASGISITPEREKIVLFSNPYEKNVRRILVSEDSKYETIRQLNGKRIGAKRGTTNEEYAATMLHAGKLYHYDNPKQGVMGLINHEVDAYVDDEGEAELIAGKNKGKIRMLDIAIPAEEYGYAFKSDDVEVKAAADRVIDAKRRSGDLPALFRKYNSIYMTLDINEL